MSAASEAQGPENGSTEQLAFIEKLGYGLGDTASNFFFRGFNIFLLYYYTDIFGLSAAAIFFYPIGRATVQQIEQELAERHAPATGN